MKRFWLFLALAAVLTSVKTISYASAGGGGGGNMGGGSGSNFSDHSAYEKAQDIQGLYEKGVEAGNKNEFNAAIGFFDEALKLNPDDADVLNMLAHAQRKVGRFDESFENYKKALELRPDFPEAREYLGEAYIQACLKEMETLKSYGKAGEEQLGLLQAAFKKAAEDMKATPSGTPSSDY